MLSYSSNCSSQAAGTATVAAPTGNAVAWVAVPSVPNVQEVYVCFVRSDGTVQPEGAFSITNPANSVVTQPAARAVISTAVAAGVISSGAAVAAMQELSVIGGLGCAGGAAATAASVTNVFGLCFLCTSSTVRSIGEIQSVLVILGAAFVLHWIVATVTAAVRAMTLSAVLSEVRFPAAFHVVVSFVWFPLWQAISTLIFGDRGADTARGLHIDTVGYVSAVCAGAFIVMYMAYTLWFVLLCVRRQLQFWWFVEMRYPFRIVDVLLQNRRWSDAVFRKQHGGYLFGFYRNKMYWFPIVVLLMTPVKTLISASSTGVCTSKLWSIAAVNVVYCIILCMCRPYWSAVRNVVTIVGQAVFTTVVVCIAYQSGGTVQGEEGQQLVSTLLLVFFAITLAVSVVGAIELLFQLKVIETHEQQLDLVRAFAYDEENPKKLNLEDDLPNVPKVEQDAASDTETDIGSEPDESAEPTTDKDNGKQLLTVPYLVEGNLQPVMTDNSDSKQLFTDVAALMTSMWQQQDGPDEQDVIMYSKNYADTLL